MKLHLTSALLLAIALLCLQAALLADDRSLEKYAKGLLQGKSLFIRNFYSNSDLEYDGEGNLINTPALDCWQRGRLRVKTVTLKQDALELQGAHIASAYDPATSVFQDFGETDKVRIEIHFAKQVSTEAELTRVLSRIFLTRDDNLKSLIPREHINPVPVASSSLHPDSPNKSGTTVTIARNFTPPRVVSFPDPEYTPQARKAGVQGTVVLWVLVGEDGRVHDVRLARGLGNCTEDLGLDQSAIKTVQQWKFDPARKDGKPVAVGVNIEINFHLYN